MTGPDLDLVAMGADAPGTSETDEIAARIRDGALTCWSRFGVAKTTLDDVAREAGCSRATVYRHYGNRTALIAAVVDREVDRVTGAVTAAADGAEDLESALVAIGAHAALQRALDIEPEVVLPALSFEGADAVLAEAGRRFAPVLARFVPPDRAPRAAEWCARVFLAHLHPDHTGDALRDPEAVRTVVRSHLLPALTPRVPVPVR